MPVANKRIQYRTQLAFKPTNVDHMKVYQHLKNLPDKTDYIVRLVLADLSSGGAIANGEGASAFGGAPAKVEKVDYGETIDVTAVCTPKVIGQLGPLVEGWRPHREPWEE